MKDLVRKLRVKLQNIVVRAVVDLPGRTYQVRHLGDRVASKIELFQTQGVHFRAPAGAQGILLAPAGETTSAVLVAAQGTVPTATLTPGEGGLHYLGTFGVWLAADGKVHLGGGTAAADFVALAAKVSAEFTKVNADLTTLKAATATGLGGVPVAGAGLASAFNTATSLVPQSHASVAATKVKAT